MLRSTTRLLSLVENDIFCRNASSIGFIGLGNMGSSMASHLVKKGENVKVFDLQSDAAQSVKGAKICKSPKEAAENSSIVITMLPTGDIVKETVLADNGILKGIPKNSLLIDSSTIEPQHAQDLSLIAQNNGIRYIDAPVSGGVTGAAAGTLTFMVGGEKKDVDSIEPILLHMGAKVYHCGGIGSGQVAKLCNNLILGISMMGVSEAMNLGIKSGLNPKTLFDIINVSTGRCWSSDTYNPVPDLTPNVPSCNDYKGGFNIRLMSKDLALAERAALSAEAPVILAATAHQIYRSLIANGYGDKDFSVIYKYLKGTK